MKENTFSVVRNCFVMVYTAQIQYHEKHLITWRVWFRTFNVFECPVNSAYTICMLFILTNTEISTMHCCLSLKCPKVHHPQSTPQPDGPKAQWILSMNNQTKTALLHLRPNISVLDISLRNPQLCPQVLLTNGKSRLDAEQN